MADTRLFTFCVKSLNVPVYNAETDTAGQDVICPVSGTQLRCMQTDFISTNQNWKHKLFFVAPDSDLFSFGFCFECLFNN